MFFFPTYFLFQLNTDGIGLLKVDSVSPQLVTERGELMVPPLPEGPLSQLELMLSPRHCRGDRGDVNVDKHKHNANATKHNSATLVFLRVLVLGSSYLLH